MAAVPLSVTFDPDRMDRVRDLGRKLHFEISVAAHFAIDCNMRAVFAAMDRA
jgi:hypothetical protein